MYSDARNECSHPLGFPIRKSPDHSLLAASRGLSQLIASFIAYLRQGIHTHALSSLTIKSTTHIQPYHRLTPGSRPSERYFFGLLTLKLVFCYARQYSIVKDLDCFSNRLNPQVQRIAACGGP